MLLEVQLAHFQSVMAHLNKELSGARVEACPALAPGVVGIRFRQRLSRWYVLLGIHPECTGISVQTNPPPAAPSVSGQSFNPRFASALAHTIVGCQLVTIELPQPDDRIARFTFSRIDKYGEEKRRVLQLELTGRTSQLFLVNEREQLISSLRKLNYEHQRARPLKTGKMLPPPPPPPPARESAPAAAIDITSILGQERTRFAAFLGASASIDRTPRKSARARRQRLNRELELARQAEIALRMIGESAPHPDGIVLALRGATSEDFVSALRERGHLTTPVDRSKLIEALRRMAGSQEKLRGFLASLPDQGEPTPRKTKRKPEPPGSELLSARIKSFPHKVRRGTTSSGFPLILTFSAEGNYAALKVFGRPEHWFFHARDFAGSYVLLLTGKEKPKPADIKQAALVAAVHSKGKREAEVEVSYTQLKYVRKPRQARTGTVLMTREQVISVRTEEWEEVRRKLFS